MKIRIAASTLTLALLAAGCATQATSSAPNPVAEEATASADGGPSAAGVPKDFPVPRGAKLEGANGSFVVVGENAEAVVGFYRKTLPAEGYKITNDDAAMGAVSIDFEGKGIKGNLAMAADAVALTIYK
jgi:hypothetical protein